jgi:hypothetical protein
MSDPVVELDSPGQNARVYLELYGGLTGDDNVISDDHYIRAVDIDMDIGGYQAAAHPYFRVSVYVREHVDGPNLRCLFRRQIDPGAELWEHVAIRVANSVQRARCVVVRVECVAYSFTPPVDAYDKHFNDQYPTADPPPWGIRITKAALYGSDLGRNVTTRRVLADILEGGGMSGGHDAKSYGLTEMYFDGLPKDRWEAIDEVVGMTGDNYVAYGNDAVHFAQPGRGADYSYAYSNPRTTWSIEKTVDEQFGGVRVGFTNAKGKRREVIVHGGSGPRNEYLDAPESIKTDHQAVRFGERFLASHGELGTAGSVTIMGVEALGLRPGGTLNGQPITAVTLHPLELSADVQFGENSRKFESWLARLAAGAKPRRR